MTRPFADEYIKVPLNTQHVLRLLQALHGPDHLIRELQMLLGSDPIVTQGFVNPIKELTDEYNAYVEKHQGMTYAWVVLSVSRLARTTAATARSS